MNPQLGRIAFNIAVLLVILTLIPLPFIKIGSAEFIVDSMALIFSLGFLLIVSWEVRRQVKGESKAPK